MCFDIRKVLLYQTTFSLLLDLYYFKVFDCIKKVIFTKTTKFVNGKNVVIILCNICDSSIDKYFRYCKCKIGIDKTLRYPTKQIWRQKYIEFFVLHYMMNTSCNAAHIFSNPLRIRIFHYVLFLKLFYINKIGKGTNSNVFTHGKNHIWACGHITRTIIIVTILWTFMTL